MGLQAVAGQTDSEDSQLPDIELDGDKTNVAAYVRVSTEKQAKEGSHESQIETIENWCERNLDGEYEIRWFKDIAESGQSLDRQEYENMIAVANEFDILIVRELSRFGRDLLKILSDLEQLESADTDFVSINNEQIDTTTPDGRLIFSIIGAVNEWYSNIKSKNAKERIERRKEKGLSVGRPRKLTEDQVEELSRLRKEEEYSYPTLAALAGERWDMDISDSTVYRLIKRYRQGDW